MLFAGLAEAVGVPGEFPEGVLKVLYQPSSRKRGTILTVMMVDVVSWPANMNVLTLRHSLAKLYLRSWD